MNEIFNPSAERGTIAGIMRHGSNSYLDVEDILRPDFFYLDSNQVIYKCIKHIFTKDPNAILDISSILSTANEIGYKDFYSNKNEVNYLRSVLNLEISESNVRKEATKVVKLAIARQLQTKIGLASEELGKVTGAESIGSILSIVESKVSELSSFLDKESQQTQQIAVGMTEWLTDLIANPRESIGVSTGMPIFDAAIGGGLRKGTTNLIAARAGKGKSSISINSGIHIAKQMIPTLYLDSEMSDKEHWARMLANLTSINITKIEQGNLSKLEAKHALEKTEFFKTIPFYRRSIAGMDFEEILSIIKRWITKEVGLIGGEAKNCVVVYDYLKLMNSKGLENFQEYQLLGFQVTELNNLAIKYQFPCLSFCQTNREGINDDSLASISQSDRISWFCSSVSIFKEKTHEEITQDKPENGNRKMLIGKARHGPGLQSGDYINLNLKGAYTQIFELGLNSDVQREKPDTFQVEDI